HLSNQDILNSLSSKLNLSSKDIDKIIVLHFDTTLIKLLMKLRIQAILQEYLLHKSSLNIVIKKYGISNKNIFKYNFQKIYNIEYSELLK
ncbi:MAG: hypothetical protein ACRDDH_02715, partial [Cetobacterium sp.]|uniref:hypothetical protein n=1 Tax=Cetobacterium sp. TaxID=2071632 RepID=UPI003EE61351